MKTTILTFALALATMPLTFAKTQTPAPGVADTSKPAVTAKVAKKHPRKAIKKTAKTPAATSAVPTPAKQ